MTDPSPIFATGGSVALFFVVAGLLMRLLILQNRREVENEKRYRDTEKKLHAVMQDNEWCNRRVSLLIRACQRGGIDIPSEVWDGPPSRNADGSSHRLRRRGAVPAGSDGDNADS